MPTKIVYSYHPTTFEFTGETIAYANPVINGDYLLPANSSWECPPPFRVGETAVFDKLSGRWNIVEDLRGKTVYTGYNSSYEMKEIGPLPAGHTLVAFPRPMEDQLREEMMVLQVRINDLNLSVLGPMRKLLLDPTDTVARKALQTADMAVSEVQSSINSLQAAIAALPK